MCINQNAAKHFKFLFIFLFHPQKIRFQKLDKMLLVLP